MIRTGVAAVALVLVCGVFADLAHAQSVDDVLTTVWEASWRQLGYPRPVSRWQGPLRVTFTGVEAERLKPAALQQLKTVAEIAGLDISEAEESAANVRVEFVDDRGPLTENQHCNTGFSTRNGVIVSGRILAKHTSAGCMLHEGMHLMGFSGHPMHHTVLSYFGRIRSLTEVDRLLLKTLYSDDVRPGMTPFAFLAVFARNFENRATTTEEKERVRAQVNAFTVRTVRDMEAYAAGNGEPPAVLFRSSKSSGAGIARGQIEMQYFLGRAFIDGELVQQDRARGVEWLKKAAASSHALAARELAKIDQ